MSSMLSQHQQALAVLLRICEGSDAIKLLLQCLYLIQPDSYDHCWSTVLQSRFIIFVECGSAERATSLVASILKNDQEKLTQFLSAKLAELEDRWLETKLFSALASYLALCTAVWVHDEVRVRRTVLKFREVQADLSDTLEESYKNEEAEADHRARCILQSLVKDNWHDHCTLCHSLALWGGFDLQVRHNSIVGLAQLMRMSSEVAATYKQTIVQLISDPEDSIACHAVEMLGALYRHQPNVIQASLFSDILKRCENRLPLQQTTVAIISQLLLQKILKEDVLFLQQIAHFLLSPFDELKLAADSFFRRWYKDLEHKDTLIPLLKCVMALYALAHLKSGHTVCRVLVVVSLVVLSRSHHSTYLQRRGRSSNHGRVHRDKLRARRSRKLQLLACMSW